MPITTDGSHADIRSLKVRSTIPIDLNSILCKYICISAQLYAEDQVALADRNHILLANLYGRDDRIMASSHRKAAAALHSAILDLLWDPAKVGLL